MLRDSRDEAMTDALTGLGNRRALARALDDALADARRRRPARARALRPRRLQALQRHLRPSRPATRCSCASARSLRDYLDGRGARVPDGRRRVLRAVRARATRSPAPIIAGAAAALSEHGEGFRDRLLLRRDRAAARGGTTPPRRCGSPTSACTRRSTRGRASADAPVQGRAAARARRARPRARRARRRRRRPRRGDRARASA